MLRLPDPKNKFLVEKELEPEVLRKRSWEKSSTSEIPDESDKQTKKRRVQIPLPQLSSDRYSDSDIDSDGAQHAVRHSSSTASSSLLSLLPKPVSAKDSSIVLSKLSPPTKQPPTCIIRKSNDCDKKSFVPAQPPSKKVCLVAGDYGSSSSEDELSVEGDEDHKSSDFFSLDSPEDTSSLLKDETTFEVTNCSDMQHRLSNQVNRFSCSYLSYSRCFCRFLQCLAIQVRCITWLAFPTVPAPLQHLQGNGLIAQSMMYRLGKWFTKMKSWRCQMVRNMSCPMI